MNDKQHIDRRKSVFMRELIVPVAVAIVVGVLSSFVTVYVSVNALQLKFEYLERDMKLIIHNASRQQDLEVKTNRLEFWVESAEKRISKIEFYIEAQKR